MKFFHLSDLHLGKSVHEFSMLEDQEHILNVILDLARIHRPDAVLIAGDVFDRNVAPTEALRLFDRFLDSLTALGIRVFIISGNHDSPDRLAFGARLMEKSGVYISPVYDGTIRPVSLEDEYGPLDLFLLPFLKPVQVRKFFPEEQIDSWSDAVRAVISRMDLRPERRGILVAHQFVTGGKAAGSEELYIGGAENIGAELFSPFDYTALGHLHGSQNIGSLPVRYCGSPLKYSFSEAGHVKSVSLVCLKEKGNLSVRELPLTPLREMRELRGTYLEVTARSFYQNQNTGDYLRITLTDEDDQPEALGKLRVIYPNLMRLDYDNRRTRADSSPAALEGALSGYTPLRLFEMLFEEQNGRPLPEDQRVFLNTLIEEIWEETP